MKYRTIKPEFFTSEQISELSFGARLCFQGLWCVSDRNGVFKWRLKQLKASIFPHDEVDIGGFLSELITVGLIIQYSVENELLGYIPNLNKHQYIHPKEPSYNFPIPGNNINSREIILNNVPCIVLDRIGSDLENLKGGWGGDEAPKPRVKDSPSIPKYKLPDKNGNERALVAGCEALWASEAEIEATFKKLSESGLRPQFHEKALLWVDSWLKENPKKLAVSSDHCARILTWGLREALKLQHDSDRASRAETVNLSSNQIVRKEDNLTKTRRVLYDNKTDNQYGSSQSTRIPGRGISKLPSIPGEGEHLGRTLSGILSKTDKGSNR